MTKEPMAKELNMDIRDLEQKLDVSGLPKALEHRVKVPLQEGGYAEYIGSAYDLYFDSGVQDIRGGASLTRIDHTPETRKRLRLESLFPLRTRTEDYTVERKHKQWEISTNYPNYFFISDGGITGYTCDAHVKGKLQGQAATQGLNLSIALLSAVFGPIERRLLKIQDAYTASYSL